MPNLVNRKTWRKVVLIREQCLVCLKPGKAKFHGVYSCDACKAFFTRVAEQNLVYKCKWKGLCYQGATSAEMRNCSACRYQKCLWVGMKSCTTLQVLLQLFFDCNYDTKPLLKKLAAMDVKRENRLLRVYSRMNPNLDEVLMHPKCVAFREIKEDTIITAHEWAFFDVYSRIISFLEFNFINELSFDDKKILFSFNSMRVLLLGGAMRMMEAKRDKLTTPKGGDAYPEVVYDMFPHDRLNKVCCKPVSRLIELKVTKEECLILMMFMFCNPTIDDLSEAAQEILSQHQQKFSTVLYHMCQLSHQQHASDRFVDLTSLISVINNADNELQIISMMFQCSVPDYPFNRLVQDTFVRVGNTNVNPMPQRKRRRLK